MRGTVRPVETPRQTPATLMASARSEALQHVSSVLGTLTQAQDSLREIAGGGDAYPVGVREHARRTADRLLSDIRTIRTILVRHD